MEIKHQIIRLSLSVSHIDKQMKQKLYFNVHLVYI